VATAKRGGEAEEAAAQWEAAAAISIALAEKHGLFAFPACPRGELLCCCFSGRNQLRLNQTHEAAGRK
jgi:hypothetical protein